MGFRCGMEMGHAGECGWPGNMPPPPIPADDTELLVWNTAFAVGAAQVLAELTRLIGEPPAYVEQDIRSLSKAKGIADAVLKMWRMAR
jgi:hypothetical protein